MAMSVGPAAGEEDEVVSTINTTPLVDVMLVLLIIFLITIPVVTTSIPVTLPKERNEIRETKPENIIALGRRQRPASSGTTCASRTPHALIERLKKIAVLESAARGADPRRRRRELRLGRPHHLRVPAGRHREGRLHHRAAGARRLTPSRDEDQPWQ